jgi:hypothetical protein
MTQKLRRCLTSTAAAVAFTILPMTAYAADVVLTTKAADSAEHGDGTMSAAASAAMTRGALPKSAAEVAAKSAATFAAGQAPAAGPEGAAPGASTTGGSAATLATIFSGLNFQGQLFANSTPPDTTGTIGITRYIQLVNKRIGIYNRTNGALIHGNTLNALTGLASGVNVFDPQIMWDAQTNRFYFFADAIFSSTDNRLAWGFSKTDSPADASSTHWCKYTTGFGSRFPDYPKLGDSQFFLIVGVNSFAPSFVGSDIISFSKPPSGTTCPAGSSFKVNVLQNIKDSGGAQVFTPVPANQIDTSATGYVVARNGGLPASKLWFRSITRNSTTGFAVYGGPRSVNVASYTLPPNAAAGTTGSRVLDTLDARPTQAVQAINPDRGTFSFWVQHTIANGGLAGVRWYEINPVPAAPVLLRQGNIFNSTAHLFNAAISPDRRVRTGFSAAFGDSFVINYSVTQRNPGGINPRIVAGSSFNGALVSNFVTLQNSTAPYIDFSCAGATATCRWGDYAGAAPDPVIPVASDRGIVWGANQFGSGGSSTAISNWRTKIFALKP